MDRSSYFIKNRAMFGSFPTQKAVNELEQEGVKFFINLTHDNERNITPYTTNYEYITFPITDRRVPYDWRAFARFLIRVSDIILGLKHGELVYVHCKGGHGRSGVVVACLLCHMFGMTPEQSLEQTTKYHSKRSVMRDKWRKIGSPQTYKQKNFVHKFFDPLNFYRACVTGYTTGISTFTAHPVEVDGIEFPTAEVAIQAFKNPTEQGYVRKQCNALTPVISKNIGREIETSEEWIQNCDKILFKILKCKFDQHPDIRENLMNTGLKPIVQHTRGDSFLGDGGDGSGENRLGLALTRLREYYYRENL